MLKTNTKQRKNPKIDKSQAGSRIKKKPGQKVNSEEIDPNDDEFREAWYQSLCQLCRNVHFCGYRVTQECEDFVPE